MTYALRPRIALEAEGAPAQFASASFQALREQWYAKLRDTGFVDSEFASMTHYHSSLPRQWARGMPSAEYFRLAGHHTHERVWQTRLAKRVWEMHAEGASTGDTGEALQLSISAPDSDLYVKRMLRYEAMRMRARYIHMRDDELHQRAVAVPSGDGVFAHTSQNPAHQNRGKYTQ